jgi:hypothetical protein
MRMSIGRPRALRAVCGAAFWAVSAAAAQPLAGPEEPYLHVVERGDTLIGLQRRLLQPGTSWRAVQRLNRIADPRKLRVGSTLRIPAALLQLESAEAEVVHAHGDVQILRGGSTTAAAGGETLRSGDEIQVGPKSSAALRLADGSRLLLRAGTRVRTERLLRVKPTGAADTRLRLHEGALDAAVPAVHVRPRLELQTPVVSLGVRGTEFRARHAETRTHAEVLSGRVAFGRVQLGAGEGAVAGGEAAGTAQALPPLPALGEMAPLVERLPLELALGPALQGQPVRALVVDGEGLVRLEGVFADAMARWPDDLPDGRYALRARRIDGASGLEGPDAERGFLLKARPEPPFVVAPGPDAVVRTPGVRFTWTAHPQGARYRLEIAAEPGFVQPLEAREVEGTSTPVDLKPGRYHWRVRTVRADGDAGPWSAPQSFTGEAEPPPAPPAAEPPRLEGERLDLRWRAGGPGTRYRLQVAKDAAFAEPLVDTELADNAYALPKPPPGTYRVRVRAIAPGGTVGPYGEPQTVEVPGFPWHWLIVPAVLLLLL